MVFVCVPVLDVKEAVYLSLLFSLICTVDIKQTGGGGEEVIASKPHSALLYMDNSPPENKHSVHLSLFFNSSIYLTFHAFCQVKRGFNTHSNEGIIRVSIFSFLFYIYISNTQQCVSILAVTLTRVCETCSVIFIIHHHSYATESHIPTKL